MQPENKPRFYYPELDGLRFIAFLLVFIHNAPAIGSNKIWAVLHEYGWIGVDLFFCLSGFLITKLLVTENQQNGKINITYFYIRRIFRILPLYYLYIAIGIFFILKTQEWDQVLVLHITGLTTFTYDFVYLFLTRKTFAVFFHLWTISYEIQFYVVFPWILQKLISVTKSKTWVFLVFIFLSGTIIRALFIYLRFPHPTIYMLPFTHFEAMLGGIAIGFGLFDDFLGNIRSEILLLVGLVISVLVVFLPNTYEIGWNLMITYSLVGIGMTLIVLGAIKNDKSFVTKLLANKVLVYLGKISYGLYIFHLLSISIVILIVLQVPELSSTLQQTLFLIGGLLLTILFSITSFHLIEEPFLKLKEKYGIISSRSV